jgi:hypothetical protein
MKNDTVKLEYIRTLKIAADYLIKPLKKAQH